MNGLDPSNLVAVAVLYLFGGVAAAFFGDAGVVVDVLAGGGLGAVVGQLVVLARMRRGLRHRTP